MCEEISHFLKYLSLCVCFSKDVKLEAAVHSCAVRNVTFISTKLCSCVVTYCLLCGTNRYEHESKNCILPRVLFQMLKF
jgi:hypothetical protein